MCKVEKVKEVLPQWCDVLGRYIKRMIRHLFNNEGTERRRDQLAMETFYYDAIYNILQETTIQESTSRTLKKLKASIVMLHYIEQQRILLDTDEHDRIAEEGPSLYHILKVRKRQEARMIQSIHGSYGNPQTNTADLLRTFTEFLRRKYDYIQVDEFCVKRMANTLNKTLPQGANNALDAPVTMEELPLSVRSGKPLKAPGIDRICQEFFKLTWETTKRVLEVLSQMHSNGTIMEQQKHGILVCLPKTPTHSRLEDYRPLTLLNADFKLLARIITNRLRPWLVDRLQLSQHSGVQGNAVLEAIAVREAVACAETTNTAQCILSQLLKVAFDNT